MTDQIGTIRISFDAGDGGTRYVTNVYVWDDGQSFEHYAHTAAINLSASLRNDGPSSSAMRNAMVYAKHRVEVRP
jgi:hypothetical protein